MRQPNDNSIISSKFYASDDLSLDSKGKLPDNAKLYFNLGNNFIITTTDDKIDTNSTADSISKSALLKHSF